MSWVFSSVLPRKASQRAQARGQHMSEDTEREAGVGCLRAQRGPWLTASKDAGNLELPPQELNLTDAVDERGRGVLPGAPSKEHSLASTLS